MQWTIEDVKRRLEYYHEDDSLFDVPAVKVSLCKTGNSSFNDKMAGIGYRLVKRAELDKAIRELPRTQKLYIYMRYIWVEGQIGEPLAVMAEFGRTSQDIIQAILGEGIHLMTEYLNKKAPFT